MGLDMTHLCSYHTGVLFADGHTGVTIPLSSQTRTTSMTLLYQLVQIWYHNMFPRLTYPIFSNLYFHISFHVMLSSTGSRNNTSTLVYYRSFCFGETLLKIGFTYANSLHTETIRHLSNKNYNI